MEMNYALKRNGVPELVWNLLPQHKLLITDLGTEKKEQSTQLNLSFPLLLLQVWCSQAAQTGFGAALN